MVTLTDFCIDKEFNSGGKKGTTLIISLSVSAGVSLLAITLVFCICKKKKNLMSKRSEGNRTPYICVKLSKFLSIV